MKIPKKVIIGSKEYKIVKDPKVSGGCFYGEGKIIIGCKKKHNIPMIFIHEVLEALLFERDCRYYLYDKDASENFRFIFNHEQFNNICQDLALALKDYLK